MKKLSIMSAFVLLSLATTSFARDYSHQCLREKWVLVKSEVKSPSTCKKDEELKLAEALFTYPLINVGPINVRYWTGSFYKTESKKDTYKREYVNICTGKVTYTSEEIFESSHTRVFKIQNPNLDATIKESFKLAPMTDAEAKVAYEHLKVECETEITE